MISINYFLDDCDLCCKCRCWCLECLFSAGFSLVSAVRGGGCAGASSPRGFQCPGTGQCWGPGPWTLDPARVLSWTHKSPLNIFSPPRQPGPWAAHTMAVTQGKADTWHRNQERSSISWPDHCHCQLWVLVLFICKHNLTIRPCLINCEWVMKISSILGQNRTNFSSS